MLTHTPIHSLTVATACLLLRPGDRLVPRRVHVESVLPSGWHDWATVATQHRLPWY
ncbi:unnamed protein product, partial [Protopolystoma xenopodis]